MSLFGAVEGLYKRRYFVTVLTVDLQEFDRKSSEVDDLC
jgi:hypothetical protein